MSLGDTMYQKKKLQLAVFGHCLLYRTIFPYVKNRYNILAANRVDKIGMFFLSYSGCFVVVHPSKQVMVI